MAETAPPLDEDIYLITVECSSLFDHLAAKDDKVEQPRNNFDKWIKYTGALAAVRRSLDDRLSGHPDIKEMVMDLLHMLKRNLKYIQEALFTAPYVQNQAMENEAYSAIEQAIDDLLFMAAVIRRSSVRNEEYILSSSFERDDELYFEKNATLLIKDKFPKARVSLHEHLGASIAIRRKQLFRKIRHEEKLSTKREKFPTSSERTNEVNDPQTPLSRSEMAPIPLPIQVLKNNNHRTGSDDTRSILDSVAARNNMKARPILSTISTGSSVQNSTIDYPPKPKYSTEDRFCLCYYCLRPLEVGRLSKDRYWENHIDEDVKPYVCLSEECTSPYQFFAHMKEWLGHMQTMHSDQWARRIHMATWYCDIDHNGTIIQFNDHQSFAEHMKDRSNHENRSPPTDLQLDALSRSQQQILVREEKFPCPLCDCVPDSINHIIRTSEPQYTQELLSKHIAEHIKPLSFISVPLLMDSNERKNEASNTDDKERSGLRGDESKASYPSWFDGSIQDISLDFDDTRRRDSDLVDLDLLLRAISDIDQTKTSSEYNTRLKDSLLSLDNSHVKTDTPETFWDDIGFSDFKSAQNVFNEERDSLLEHFAQIQMSESIKISFFPDGLKVLHDCSDAMVDICFIHGLSGDRETTWTAEKQSAPWPKTFLPSKLPKARILMYGYDAYLVRLSTVSTTRIIDHAAKLVNDLTTDRTSCNALSRPLIFVAHSLGGIVCKKAILLSRNHPVPLFRDIFDCTKGILFLGTPHKGAWMADWANIPAFALGFVKNTNVSLLEILQTGNEALELIQIDFWSMIRERQKYDQPPHVTCIFEELPLKRIGRVVVSKDSATLEGYNSFSIHADHSQMVKFTSMEEIGLKRVLGELLIWQITIDSSENLKKDCLNSLAFPNMQTRFHDIDHATAGTCKWLLQHKTYNMWASSDKGLLWIKGKPGSGKSTLLKYAVNNFQAEDTTLVLSFFFHGRGNQLQMSRLGFFQSILHQILRLAPHALLDLVKTYETKCKEIGKFGDKWQWNLEELEHFFDLCLPKILVTCSVVLFIDALDECGKSNALKLIQNFKSLLESVRNSSSSFKWFRICFSCRHYPILDMVGVLEICLEQENEDDISTYVNHQLSRSDVLPTSKIPALIISRASGVFLWAYLIVDMALSLDLEGRELIEIEEEIQRIPEDLENLYQELIGEMKEKSVSWKLILWVSFARTPLSLEELRWAMVVEPDRLESMQDVQSRKDFVSDNDKLTRRVQTLSCGLVEVKETVEFIHPTVKDFFIEKGLSVLDSSSTSLGTVEGTANFQLFKTCLRYLDMVKPVDSEIDVHVKIRAFPFWRYAWWSWPTHMTRSIESLVAKDKIFEVLSSTDIETKGDLDMTPLSATACKGHETVARLLLEGGADVEAKDQDQKTPLWLASQNGHEAVVKLLLENRADLETKDLDGRTPLFEAALEGHEAVVKLLLERGANLEARDQSGQTPLLGAVKGGDEAVGRFLLEKGSKLALVSAARRDSEAVVRSLLDEGADLEARDQLGDTPLFGAAKTGYEAVVRLLLEKGADLEARDRLGQTPLFGAAKTGDEAVVRLLLENGANLEAKDQDGRTPLSWAVEKGHKAVVDIMLSYGAVLEAGDHHD